MALYEIKNRWTGAVLFSLECGSLKLCVEAAVKARADLSDANLRDADLRAANLSAANLRGADLSDANLRAADLSAANLRGADLRDADLRAANLSDANLRAANLSDANLTPIRDDLWSVLSSAPREVPALIVALKEGRVDGSTYSGECACLCGTIANAIGKTVTNAGQNVIDGLTTNPSRPIERFFLNILKGDTPETNQTSKIVVKWAEEWLARMQAAFSGEAVKS